MLRRDFGRMSLASLWAIGLAAQESLGQAPRKKADKVVGIIWEFKMNRLRDQKKTEEKFEGRFRVHNYEVFRGPVLVGRVEPMGPMDTKITITEWPEMNGVLTLKMIGKQPQTWAGKLVRDDGSEWAVGVRVRSL
jgi:hypothetical protein